MELLFRDAMVLGMRDAADVTADKVDVHVSGDRIAAIGPALAVPAGARVVDASDALLMPGMVNAHIHTEQNSFRARYPRPTARGADALRLPPHRRRAARHEPDLPSDAARGDRVAEERRHLDPRRCDGGSDAGTRSPRRRVSRLRRDRDACERVRPRHEPAVLRDHPVPRGHAAGRDEGEVPADSPDHARCVHGILRGGDRAVPRDRERPSAVRRRTVRPAALHGGAARLGRRPVPAPQRADAYPHPRDAHAARDGREALWPEPDPTDGGSERPSRARQHRPRDLGRRRRHRDRCGEWRLRRPQPGLQPPDRFGRRSAAQARCGPA